MGDKQEFLTPKELTKRYKGKINERTLANWRSKGEGPAWVKVGGRVMYELTDVKAWEKKRTIGK